MLGAESLDIPKDKEITEHPSIEDLMLMIDLLKPKYYMPVEGAVKCPYAAPDNRQNRRLKFTGQALFPRALDDADDDGDEIDDDSVNG